MAGRILPPLSVILPFWLVQSMVGWRETAAVWPALVVSGGSFAAMQFYWSNYQESGLVDIVSALVSLLATALCLKLWRPGRSCRPATGRSGDQTAMRTTAGTMAPPCSGAGRRSCWPRCSSSSGACRPSASI